MNKIAENWDLIKETVRNEYEISLIPYTTWIEPMKLGEIKDNVVYVVFPSDRIETLNYLTKKFKDFFTFIISDFMNEQYCVEFILEKDSINNKEETSVKELDESIYKNSNLVAKYTFDNFVVGSNNNFAHSACVAVAESPGEDFNPLFIYGGSGLGKTHLMHSIGHYILDHNPEMKVLYVNSETFTNEVIESLRNGNSSAMNKFREKYRTVDVLLIDDIQFIIGKEMTQEEFFHTFNALYEAGKAIIISSDKHPKQMETLDERFRSRFQMGLQADIQPPNYETRVAILLKLAEPYNAMASEDKKISNEVIEYIATNIKSNIRELEGSFNKVLAFSKISNNSVSLELAEEALKDMIYPDKPKIITPTIIIQVVAEHYGIKPEDITSQKRNAEYVLPRHVVMYLCHHLAYIPYTTIAKVLDKKDHSTIINGCRKIEKNIQTNSELSNTIEVIKKKIIPS